MIDRELVAQLKEAQQGCDTVAVDVATLDQLLDIALWVKDSALPAMLKSHPMIRGCSTTQGDHDDTSWCTANCGDYGRTLRDALNSFPESL